MSGTRHQPARPSRSGRRALGGIAAAVLLAALVGGTPWALARFVGWPLPDHMPTSTELALHLLGPLSARLLIDALACVCWLVWAVFTVDVARCTVDAVRNLRPPAMPRLSPTRALAAVLVGAVVLSILGSRQTGRELRNPAAGPERLWDHAVTATAWASPRLALVSLPNDDAPLKITAQQPRSVIVRAPDPDTGIHDSLWRIAQRQLGSGARWPEIFELNEGKPQPGGRTFTRPSLIFPGEELRLPVDELPPGAAPTPVEALPTQPAGPTATLLPDTRIPTTTASPRPVPDLRAVPTGDGAPWAPQMFAGLGLAAAAGAALAVALRRRRRRYRPGSGIRDDLPTAPTIYQLRLAHQRDTDPDADDEPGADGETVADHWLSPDRVEPTRDPDADAVGDALAIAAAAASTHGLGLTGPGAVAALRAVLLTLLTTANDDREPLRVLVTRDLLAELLGSAGARVPYPPALEVFDSLDEALDELDTEALTRAAADAPRGAPKLVLLARPTATDHPRLQSVLDNGAELGITGLLFGQWRPGSTIRVSDDGTVTATGPGPCGALRGHPIFSVDVETAAEILQLLRDAGPPDRPDGARCPPEDELEVTEIRAGDPGTRDGGPRSTTTHSAGPAHGGRTDPADPGPVGTGTPCPIRIDILGRPRILWRPAARPDGEQEITGRLQPRARELLVFLALHPSGASRDTVAVTLWPESGPGRTTNAMNTALTRLRQAVARATHEQLGEVVRTDDGRIGLDPTLVEVDYWRFAAAVAARRAATNDADRLAAHQCVVDSYGGELAEDTPIEWIGPIREAVRRDAIDSVAALARAFVTTDPQRTLDLLEIARAFDPYNEMIYRDIMRLQGRLGLADAIPRTLALLTTRLAETGDRPADDTIDLAARLRQRQSDREEQRDVEPTAPQRDGIDGGRGVQAG